MATKKVILDDVTKMNEEVMWLFRRLLKILESNATVDKRNRQRVVIDGIGTGSTGITTELSAALPVSLTNNVTSATGNAAWTPLPGATTSSIVAIPIAEGPVDQRWRVAEDSHISYQLGIRNKLSFT